MFEVTVGIPEGDGGFFDDFWKELESLKGPAEEKIKELLEKRAKSHHKYKVQTGQLKKATKTEGDFAKGISLYVDTSQADYAKYVIEEKYFNDPFIADSLKFNERKIEKIIKDMYEAAVDEFNKG